VSVRAFAERVGFSASFISQLETGQVSPSIASLGKIAAALNTTLAELFARSSDDGLSVVRAKKRPSFRSSWSRAQIAVLTAGFTGIQALMVTLEPGGLSGKEPFPSTYDQLAIVFSGVLELTLGQEVLTLHRGDTVQIGARTPHRWHNASRRPARVVLLSSRPTP
jgi:quercetin dioxygenase-like cupin family protein/DNA-binding XRE family transcriptional regulator